MEHINKVELQGHVGTVRINTVGEDKIVINFTLATEHFYKSKEGTGTSETTWHNIVLWGGKDTPDANTIIKGAPVYVNGRLRCNKYTAADGVEKQYYEIVASKVKVLSE